MLASSAERAGDALMPSYTHLRRAQPILAAHFFLAHAAALRRDHARFAALLDDADELPLGSGAIAGTSYSIDVPWLARELGFSRIVANSIDATGDRDFVATFLYASSLTMVHLSRLAEDTILFTSEEFGFFELADTAATGSSLMPQKKNPDPLELVRGKAGRVIGRLSGWLATMKGLPIGYSKDLQEDKEALFEAEDTLRASLAATASVVGGLTINRDITARAASGLLLATDVADYLVAKGVPFRDAHEIVGALVQAPRQGGRIIRRSVARRLAGALTAVRRRRAQCVTAAASVGKKRTPQSTHPDAVRAASGGTAGVGEGARSVIYLVHHADAVGPEVEPQRPLSRQGMRTRGACREGSGERREARRDLAQRQAASAADRGAVSSDSAIRWPSSRRSMDSSPPIHRCGSTISLTDEQRDVMLVGHMPNLPRVLTLLVSGDESSLLTFPLHGMIALERRR